ncbi:multidrug transport protein [Xenorhabdus mauleonii]|uniref:Multidrug resistance protein MdtH n=1 Tax=Xenorhabdus mauleonii TaxID=351675 RepID=A0A1I3R1H9_9GAMM|nr:multidrug efflux MFS transporter MdtH [Xenorhabdus mauleonii]PHM38670.1 multidrug transport protein [Xenorhabdus mauleonii]SFJ39106.1 MFS transporter, DHA1 family, multidrug resistance protein [Xenorhabdus mauleonii]
MSLVSQARRLGKYFLLIDNLIVVLGFFVVFPLISIRFVEQLGWAAAIVGFALGLRQLTQQGLGIFGGAIADKFGAKPLIVTGMLLRAVGFGLMALASEPWILLLSCILSGLGGTLFDPPRAALIIKLTRPHERGRFYSILLMQDSAGAVIGALIGSWLLQYNFNIVCWVGAAIFVLVALLNAYFLPAYRISTIRTPIKEGMKRVIKDSRFFFYVLTLTGFFVLSVQVMLMFPIIIHEISGTAAAVKWMYAIEAFISLTLLYPIARWSEKRFRQEQRLMAGLCLMSICMFPIGWVNQLHILFGLISLFYLGMVTAEPAREMLSASLTDPRARGSYMGFSRLGLAFGGVLGYTGGGWLYDTGKNMNLPQLPWILLGTVGLITIYALHRQFNQRKIKAAVVSKL